MPDKKKKVLLVREILLRGFAGEGGEGNGRENEHRSNMQIVKDVLVLNEVNQSCEGGWSWCRRVVCS